MEKIKKAIKCAILNWLPKLKEGGLLCGHDFGYKGVARAVKELVEGFECGGGSIWYRRA